MELNEPIYVHMRNPKVTLFEGTEFRVKFSGDEESRAMNCSVPFL
jgi:hypothetical protein